MTDQNFSTFQIRNLPGYAKIFVGIFTTLMVLVCLWAIWIFYESRGKIEEGTLPPYLSDTTAVDTVRMSDIPKEAVHDIEEIMEDTAAVHSPEWDTPHAGEEEPIDSADIVRIAALAATGRDTADLEAHQRPVSRFRHNLGLAHTHVNGQTLLYFAIGLVFLFTSVTPKMKKILFALFGVCVVAHTIGLTGQGFSSIYDDVLAVSGVLLLIIIVYMAFLIFVDLSKKPRTTA